ncbi:FtsX-like permease family protein [Streptomyces sp. NPDC088197]|uniref:FtsX-like permease family protein n=1 Tax=Streptomyces sp. NPDC088197 TaxID=3365840 RepID=UPI0038125D89
MNSREPHGTGAPDQPAGVRTWARDLALGARFAAGGGREGWTRTVLTAVGVGLGVALLLLAAAVPAMLDTREQKRVARDTSSATFIAKPSDRSLLVADVRTVYRDSQIGGSLLQAEGAKAPSPPGVAHLPGAGEMVVSPALRKLLDSTPLLRERIPYKITGTVGEAGLMGPSELLYYAGSDQLTARDENYGHGNATRVTSYGYHAPSEAMSPVLTLLLVVMLVVLLLPVAVFVGAAVRLGGERRDRRLAAMRLVGADIRMTRRIAAGEALLGSLFGLVLGAVFFFTGRQLASHFTIHDISAFPADMTPNAALTTLIVLAVPVAAVAVTLVSLRGTAIEPLGVVRQGLGRRRTLWWRLLVPLVGIGLLVPLFGSVNGSDAHVNEYQTAAGAVLLLFGVTTVLPWVVEAVVGRLRGGPVAWQLATRRLQLNSNGSARMVSGVTVAVAGAIALQMLFAGVNDSFVHSTGADTSRIQATVSAPTADARQAVDYTAKVRATPGVARAYGFIDTRATQPDASKLGPDAETAYIPLLVADCDTLRQMADIGSCGAGSVYIVPNNEQWGASSNADLAKYAKPGKRLDLNTGALPYTGAPRLWTVPSDARSVTARTDPRGQTNWGVLLTPEAVDQSKLADPTAVVMVNLDAGKRDAVEYLRNTGAALGPTVTVSAVSDSTTQTQYGQLRRGLFVGAAITMALIGASLLVTMLEQLRDRKKLLAVLVAFGTRRTALAWSVLWQTAIPMALGLVLACVGGLGLGAALLAMVGRTFHVDWAIVAQMSAIGASVVLAVTLLSLPPLWRLMRPDGLRTE